MPFAVVGSNTLIEICGKKVRGRLYPWGVVEGKILKEIKATLSTTATLGDRVSGSCKEMSVMVWL